MSESTSLYRRHRPASFDQVVGQRHVVRTLSNAIEANNVHHAYLFVGSRGTGKTSMAKILAASLNCERGGPTLTPCGQCQSCRSVQAGTSVDVIEMDAASNRSVDDIRGLRDRVAFAPAAGRWKVYILDEAHMLTKEAWNAFLKTLEEPPPNTIFILATTEAHKVMPTIADRCQRFDFQRPSIEQLTEVLNRVAAAESIEVDAAAISMIARSASGSFRDALGTLDQLLAYSSDGIAIDDVLELLGAPDADLLFGVIDGVIASDPKAVLESVETMARSGRDSARFARDLLGHLRILLVTRTTGEIPEAFAVTASDTARLRAQAEAIGPANLIRDYRRDRRFAGFDPRRGRSPPCGRSCAAEGGPTRPRPVGRRPHAPVGAAGARRARRRLRLAATTPPSAAAPAPRPSTGGRGSPQCHRRNLRRRPKGRRPPSIRLPWQMPGCTRPRLRQTGLHPPNPRRQTAAPELAPEPPGVDLAHAGQVWPAVMDALRSTASARPPRTSKARARWRSRAGA